MPVERAAGQAGFGQRGARFTPGRPVSPADVESGKVRAYQKDIDEYWKI